MNDNKELVILAGKSSGGDSVTAASVLSAMEDMDSSQQSAARAAIGATDALTSIPDNVKQALLNVISHVAFIDANGQDYYDELSAALYLGPLESISAVFTQGANVIYDTDSLDDLKQYLVVTAHYSVAGDVEVTGYDLTGSLTVGTSTITVSYGGQTTTFSVNVSTIFMTMTYTKYNWVRATDQGTYAEWVWKAASLTTARAGSDIVFPNNNYVFTVTDSSKYNLVAYNISSDEATQITIGGRTDYAYPGSSNEKSWAASGSSTGDYVALSFKKLDNTDFTDEELASMYGTVFTVA